MRVVAGEVKGFQLRAPRGMDTRPTSDKVREAMFAVLGPAVDGARVLDLYAGTGALAIEALSRGADQADLVEKRPAACQIIRVNLSRTRFTDRAHLRCMSAERALKELGNRRQEIDPFDLVLLDPPYAHRDIATVMSDLGTGAILAAGALVVLEHSPRFQAELEYGVLSRWQYKIYGDTAVSFYQAPGPASEAL